MSLATTLTLGGALGGVAAVAIYTAVVPAGAAPAQTQPVSVQAVPTPTRTALAPCVAPAVLEHGYCVTHVPGPPVTTSQAQSVSTSVTAAASTPTAAAPTGQSSAPREHDGDEHHGGGDD